MVSVSRQTICAVELECCDPSIWLAFDIAQLFDMKIEDVFPDNRIEIIYKVHDLFE